MSIFRSSIIVALGTLSSRILGFVRDLLMARFLGTTASADIFFIAIKIPNTIRQIFGEGAFNLAFVPLFKQHCDDNDVNPKAISFVQNSFSIFMIAITFFVILAEIFMPNIIRTLAPSINELGPEKFDLAVDVSRVLMPYIFFVSYMTFIGAVLNSLTKFAALAFAPAMLNIGYIVAFAVFSMSDYNLDNIAYVPAIGMLLGGVMQALVMYLSVRKLPFKISFKKPVINKDIKTLFAKFIPTMLGSGIVILNSLVSVFLASSLGVGVVSYLFYADRLVQLPTALIGTALATALLPNLTQKLKQNINIEKSFTRIFSISLIIGAFCMSYVYNYSDLIINVLFQRGAFDQSAADHTSAALSLMSLSIPAIISMKVLNVIFYAKGNTKLPTIIAGASFVINLVLCLVLMQKYSYLGLVLAGVISIYFTMLVQLIILLKNRVLIYKDILKSLTTFILFAGIIITFYNLANSYFIVEHNISIIQKLLWLVLFGVIGSVMTYSYVVLLKLNSQK